MAAGLTLSVYMVLLSLCTWNILAVLVPQELELEVSQLRQDREQLETDCKKIQTDLNSKTQLLNTQEEVHRVCN